MHTHALFEDQSTSPLLCDFFATDPGDDPVRLVFPDLEDTRVRHSASNGCLAAYQVLYQLGYLTPGEHFCLSFQFSDHHRSFNSHGSSAGLAFCLKFAQEVYQLKTGRRLDHSIAATGSISDGTRGAKVEKVQSLRNKLLAAFEVLSPGDAIFFPADSEADLDPELRGMAAAKQLRLCPVSTVDQALRILLPSLNRFARRWRRRVLTLTLTVASLVGLFYAAKQLRSLKPGHQMTRLPQSLFTADSLRIEGFFHYRSSAAHGTRAIPSPGPLASPLTLYSGDLYKFSFTANDSCYLYVFQLDSRGQVEQWPDPEPLAGPLRLEPSLTVQIPHDLEDWLILDQQVGQERLFVLGVRNRDRELEGLYTDFRRAVESGKWGLRARLEAYLRSLANPSDPGAVFLVEFAVEHAPASALPRNLLDPDLQIDFPIAMTLNSGSEGHLYILSRDSADLPKPVYRRAGDYLLTPAWSPDGKRVAFSAESAGTRTADIYVVNADGSGQTNLTHDPACDNHPDWSPDGHWIVFCSNRGKGNPDDFDLYLMRADGSELCPLDTTSDRTEQPAWSPDGAWIAYVRSTTFDDHRLWLTNADGTRHQIVNPSIFPINATAPTWSNDASKLFFTGTIPGLPSRLGCINADGSGGLHVAVEGIDTGPHLSPEGNAILVCRQYFSGHYAPVILDLTWHDPLPKQLLKPTGVNLPSEFSWAEGLRNLGEAPIGSQTGRMVALVNRGGSNLEVTGLTFDDPQFSVAKQQFILAPQESRAVELRFKPEKTGTSYATLHITSNDPDAPDIDLIVNATGLPGPVSDSAAKAF